MIAFRKPFWLLCIISIVCISCMGEADPRLQKLDALDAKLAKVDSLYQPVDADTARIRAYFNNAVKSLKFVQNNYTDTMPLDLAVFLSDYRADRKLLGWTAKTAHSCAVDMTYARKQIANLRTDIENNKLDDSKFEEYYATEAGSIEELLTLVTDLNGKWQKAISRYEERNPRVQELVNELGGF